MPMDIYDRGTKWETSSAQDLSPFELLSLIVSYKIQTRKPYSAHTVRIFFPSKRRTVGILFFAGFGVRNQSSSSGGIGLCQCLSSDLLTRGPKLQPRERELSSNRWVGGSV